MDQMISKFRVGIQLYLAHRRFFKNAWQLSRMTGNQQTFWDVANFQLKLFSLPAPE